MKRFIVLSRGRTASTYLMKGLNQHPDISMSSEILKYPNPAPINGITFDSSQDSWAFLLENLWTVNATKPIVGFKLFFFHCRGHEGPASTVWSEIEKSQDLSLVLLSRNNTFASFISAVRATSSQKWHPINPSEYSKTVDIVVDIEKMRKHMDSAKKDYDHGKSLLAEKGGYYVTYEDMRDDASSVFRGISDYLGAENSEVSWPKFATGSESGSATKILNLDEVASALKRRGDDWMIEPYLHY